ncbi:MAG: phosphoesterase [Pirellulaceae bacterium]|nr:MAG: phosphoesterase [Pirellulaceae bacterium]
MNEEHVLVIPADWFRRAGYFQGFRPDDGRFLEQLLRPEQLSYRPRSSAEQDPSFKQLIPYVLFRSRTPDGCVRLFAYTRGSGQGEKRLHAKRSIGVGGHISSQDATSVNLQDAYREGLQRELAEEVRIETRYRMACVGLINDDMTDVGRVHLGIVHVCDVEQPAVYPREEDILDAAFTDVASLWQEWDRMESWSQICLQALFGWESHGQAKLL